MLLVSSVDMVKFLRQPGRSSSWFGLSMLQAKAISLDTPDEGFISELGFRLTSVVACA